MWLDVWAFAHVVMIDCDMAVANQAPSLKFLKLNVVKFVHQSSVGELLLRFMRSIRGSTIVDVGNVHQSQTGLG